LKKYNTFVEEIPFYDKNGYKTIIKKENIKKIISENCKDFSWEDKPIYRGVETDDLFIVDPTLSERKSANTQNFYTYLIDNSEEWKDYPDRSKSIICSHNSEVARIYSNSKYPHRVIPFDDAKIGICSKHDFWFSFIGCSDLFSSLVEFNDFIYFVGKILKIEFNNNDKELFFEKFEFFLDKMTQISPEELSKKIEKSYGIYITHDTVEMFKKFPKTLEEINDLLDPKNNDFKLKSYKDAIKLKEHDIEVWTDSKCLIIPGEISEELENEYKKKSKLILIKK